MSRRGALNRMSFHVSAGFQNRRIGVPHRRTKLTTIASEKLSLPRVVLGVDLALSICVVDDTDAEVSAGSCGIER